MPTDQEAVGRQRQSDFGRSVRTAREARGLTQERFAELAGVHRNLIQVIERGDGNPRMLTVYAIASALEIEAKDLFPS